jgi:hypothetical protein
VGKKKRKNPTGQRNNNVGTSYHNVFEIATPSKEDLWIGRRLKDHQCHSRDRRCHSKDRVEGQGLDQIRQM